MVLERRVGVVNRTIGATGNAELFDDRSGPILAIKASLLLSLSE